MKNPANSINLLVIAVIMIYVVGILLISGCSQQKQQPTAAQQTPAPQAEIQPTQQPEQQPAQQPAEADPDVYKDNLDQSIDELNQLGT